VNCVGGAEELAGDEYGLTGKVGGKFGGGDCL
jgi:hypothetical protein